jgi:DNA-binding IclR family transcriptional regulator
MQTVRAAERALDILMCFTPETPELTISEVEKAVGLARPTLYRLLQTLQKKHLVRSVGEPPRYRLNYGVMKLAGVWLSDSDVVRTAEPYVKELRERSDETAALYIPLSDVMRMCVQEMRSRQALSYARGVGHTAAMTEGASGKIILAHLPEKRRDDVLRTIENVHRRDELRDELERMHREGIAVTHSELIVGAVAIAAPLLGARQEVLGSICLFGPDARINGKVLERCVDLVRRAGTEISAMQGHEKAA